MPSRDVNAVTRLADASWWRDNGWYRSFVSNRTQFTLILYNVDAEKVV